jgi:hypothetical protein
MSTKVKEQPTKNDEILIKAVNDYSREYYEQMKEKLSRDNLMDGDIYTIRRMLPKEWHWIDVRRLRTLIVNRCGKKGWLNLYGGHGPSEGWANRKREGESQLDLMKFLNESGED